MASNDDVYSSPSSGPSRTRTKSPVTPPKTPPRIRRPSLAALPNPMNWLGRSSSSASAPYATAIKPVRISEPKLSNSLELWAVPRSGSLGSGATVVRTPQEALVAHLSYRPEVDSMGKKRRADSAESFSEMFEDAEEDASLESLGSKEEADLPSPPDSPPLPPLPLSLKSTPDLSLRAHPSSSSSTSLPPPTRPPPCPPTRPALKNARTSPSPPSSTYFPAVPAVPSHLSSPVPQPPFSAILVSALPSVPIDPSKVLVTLETNTVTYRTTFATLAAQPSHLHSYLADLLPDEDDEDGDERSLRSFASDAESSFNSIFHHHLTASGLLSQSTTNVHVFLDRPSPSYAHILTYLRSPTLGLPRPVQLSSCSSRTEASARLESLLDLRDEAAYLGLDDLQRLCTEEIRSKYTLSHAPSHSSASESHPVQLKHHRGGSTTSVHSMQTLREVEAEAEAPEAPPPKSHSRERGYGHGRNVSESVTVTNVPGLRDRLVRSASNNDGQRSPGFGASSSVRTRPAANWI